MSKPLLGIAVAVLLAVVVIQAIFLIDSPTPTRADSQPAATAPDTETIAKRLSQFGRVKNVTHLEGKNLFRATVGGRIVYVTPDGQYLLAGDLYDLSARENLTAAVRAKHRVQMLASLDKEDAIVFEPKGKTKAVVWVFTDVTCPYCQKFHSQIEQYLARGIEVRYLAFPRGGPHSRTWRLAKSVWCADNSRRALTQAKNNPAEVPRRQCENAPIREQYQAGIAMGLRGTPLIVTSKGRKIGGYLPPEALARRLHLGS